MAMFLNVKVDKIYLYPFGGISKFFLPLNSSFIKEFLILIFGPLSQILTRFLLIYLFPKYREFIDLYHYGILFFNLLPVYPLDGGKLCVLFLSLFMPLLKSYKISFLLGYFIIFLYFIFSINNLKINDIIIVSFLLYKINYERKQLPNIYEKFLLERYLYKYNFKCSKIITNKKNFYKNRRHLIKDDDKYYTEKEFLQKKYKKF